MLDPAPLPLQALSLTYDADESRFRVVPPTATTNGSEAGYDASQQVLAPESPELAKMLVPCETIVTNNW